MKRYKHKTIDGHIIRVAVAIIAFIALTVLLGIYDLRISLSVYNPNSWWASAFALGGRIAAPVMLLSGVNFICWNSNQIRPSKWYNVVDEIAILIAIGLILVNCGGFRGWWQEIIIGVIYFSLYLLIQLRGHKMSWQQRKHLEKIIVMAFAAAIIMLILVEILKNLSGRPRFRDLESLNDFVWWHRWNPWSSGRSLPSGHTANSCATVGVALAARMCRDKWKRIVIGALPIVYLLIMAVSRVVMGAHFASDVFISLGLVVVVWAIVCKIFHYGWRSIKRW